MNDRMGLANICRWGMGVGLSVGGFALSGLLLSQTTASAHADTASDLVQAMLDELNGSTQHGGALMNAIDVAEDPNSSFYAHNQDLALQNELTFQKHEIDFLNSLHPENHETDQTAISFLTGLKGGIDNLLSNDDEFTEDLGNGGFVQQFYLTFDDAREWLDEGSIDGSNVLVGLTVG